MQKGKKTKCFEERLPSNAPEAKYFSSRLCIFLFIYIHILVCAEAIHFCVFFSSKNQFSLNHESFWIRIKYNDLQGAPKLVMSYLLCSVVLKLEKITRERERRREQKAKDIYRVWLKHKTRHANLCNVSCKSWFGLLLVYKCLYSLLSILASCHKSQPFLCSCCLVVGSSVRSLVCSATVQNMHNLPTTQIPLIIVDSDSLIINDNEEINNNNNKKRFWNERKNKMQTKTCTRWR